MNEAQENQEQLQQQLAIAQVRVDETERWRAQTEQTIVQLIALEQMNLAQAQLEQEIARGRQEDLDQAVRDRLLRDQRELERERQATIAEIELIKQLQAEDSLRQALNQVRGILGESGLAATDDVEELENQLAGLRSHLGSTEAQLAGVLEGFDKLEAEQLADFPEELKTLLADAKKDINDALQGKEAATIALTSLMPGMFGLQEQLESYQEEIKLITADDEADYKLLETLTARLENNLDDFQHEVAKADILEEEKEILEPEYQASLHAVQYADQAQDFSKHLAKQSWQAIEQIIQKRIEKREAAKKSFFGKVLGIVSQIVGILSTIAGILAFAFPPLAPLAAGLIAVSGIVNGVQAAMNGDWMGAIFTVVTSAASALTAGMSNVLSESAKLAIQGLQSVASGAFSGVRSIMSGDSILGGLQILSGFAGAVANGVQGFFGQLTTAGQNALYQVFKTLQSVPTMIYGSIQGIENGDWFGAISNIFNVITTIGSNFGGMLNDTVGKIFENLSKFGNTGLAIGGAAMDGTVEAFLAATNGVLGIWKEDIGSLVGNIVGKDECVCFAQSESKPELEGNDYEGATIYYINGINTPPDEYLENIEKLNSLDLTINENTYNKSWPFDLVQAAIQAILPFADPEGNKFTQNARQQIIKNAEANPDKPIVIVAHSQGNFFTEDIARKLPPKIRQRVNIVSLAPYTDYNGFGSQGKFQFTNKITTNSEGQANVISFMRPGDYPDKLKRLPAIAVPPGVIMLPERPELSISEKHDFHTYIDDPQVQALLKDVINLP